MGIQRRRLVTAITVAGLLLAACGDDTSDQGATDGATDAAATTGDAEAKPPAVLAVTATDAGDGTGYAFEAAATVSAGTYEIDLTNTGAEAHHAQIYRLNDDKTLADLAAAGEAENPEAAMFEIGTIEGGTGATDPGATSAANAFAELGPGQYVWLCFLPDAGGTAHVESGMALPFTVEEAQDPAAEVEADAAVTLVDFSIGLPESIESGAIVEFRNDSATEFHEANILQLADGATVDDALTFFADPAAFGGPPPFRMVGGMQGLMPGASQKLDFGVDAGTYVFICFIPTPGSDFAPHFTKGMVAQLTVA